MIRKFNMVLFIACVFSLIGMLCADIKQVRAEAGTLTDCPSQKYWELGGQCNGQRIYNYKGRFCFLKVGGGCCTYDVWSVKCAPTGVVFQDYGQLVGSPVIPGNCYVPPTNPNAISTCQPVTP